MAHLKNMNDIDSIKAVNDIIYNTLLANVARTIQINSLASCIKPFSSRHTVENMEAVIYKNAYIR